MVPNGEIVIDRLENIKASLERTIGHIEKELGSRDSHQTYTETYAQHLTYLLGQVKSRENDIRKFVHGG